MSDKKKVTWVFSDDRKNTVEGDKESCERLFYILKYSHRNCQCDTVTVTIVDHKTKEKEMSKDFAYVAQIQEKFQKAGYRWQEETFSNGDVIIDFTLSDHNHVFSDPELYDLRKYGWGRFPRLDAWIMAKEFLLDEKNTSFLDWWLKNN